MSQAQEPLKHRTLLLAPAGVATINIDGTTVHSGLGIDIEFFGCINQIPFADLPVLVWGDLYQFPHLLYQ